VAANTLIK